MGEAGAGKTAVTLGAIGPQILKPVKWQRGSLSKRWRHVANLCPASRNNGQLGAPNLGQNWRVIIFHMDLRRALGILSVVELTDLKAATAEDFIALKGAALVLAEREQKRRNPQRSAFGRFPRHGTLARCRWISLATKKPQLRILIQAIHRTKLTLFP